MIATGKHITRCFAVLFVLAAPARAGDVQSHVVFTEASPLASGKEMLRRIYTPIVAAPFNTIDGLPLDLTKERFTVYVPSRKPPNGYALMVFVPPWNDGHMPVEWPPVLDDYGVIFVTAENSGNDAHVRLRRVPLALIGAQNVMHHYEIDPSRVLIAGFSGGARVALGVALAYPDIFHGAFLNSGSDPIGTTQNPLPAASLFDRFQTSSRIAYITGDHDPVPANEARDSARSLNEFCIANVSTFTMAHTDHRAADGDTFAKALDVLLAPSPPPPSDMADCRAKLDNTVQAQLQQVETLIATGDKAGARQLLDAIDTKYGGLAAPKSLALDAELPK
jgi:hypothetical protein